MNETCQPPVHRFDGSERTCRCGQMVVPDPTARFMQSMQNGAMHPARRRARPPSALGRLRVPQGPGKPPSR